MIKIAHKKETENLKQLSVGIIEKVTEIATILDDNHGYTRNIVELGGYIEIIEVAEYVETVRKQMDFEYNLPEYVDLIRCENGNRYTNSLMLLSSDYSISLLIPLRLTPKQLLNQMEE